MLSSYFHEITYFFCHESYSIDQFFINLTLLLFFFLELSIISHIKSKMMPNLISYINEFHLLLQVRHYDLG
jgi:hypothetical protein